MDWQKIKERVTEEVLRQLQAEQAGGGAGVGGGAAVAVTAPPAAATAPGAAAPGAPAGGPAPAACAGGPALPACEVLPDFKTDVLAVVAGPVCDRVIGVLKGMAAQRQVTVVASGGVSSSRLADLKACGQFYCEGNEALARRLVESAGTIVVPVITTTVAAKVAGLIGDCLPSTVLVQAALAGKKAVVANESLAASSGAPWAIRRKVEEVTAGLRSLGFTITDLKGLAPDGKARSTGQGFVPAYPRTGGGDNGTDVELARMIDHTLLKPESTAEQVTRLCQEAREYSFASVCVNPSWVPLCAKLLAGTPVKVCTVIGFPLGATSGNAKALEAADAIQKGATEVDMVLNVGALKSGLHDVVLNDITGVVQAAKGKALVKVILETGLLTDEEKVKACQLAKQAGADFVKTSTGFGPGGATAHDIALMRRTVGPELGVKASGGIRDWDAATAMVKAGATRIGASASINIVKRVKAQATKEKY